MEMTSDTSVSLEMVSLQRLLTYSVKIQDPQVCVYVKIRVQNMKRSEF